MKLFRRWNINAVTFMTTHEGSQLYVAEDEKEFGVLGHCTMLKELKLESEHAEMIINAMKEPRFKAALEGLVNSVLKG